MTRAYESAAERAFQLKLAVRLIEREERAKARQRDLREKAKLGVLSADERRWLGPPSRVGRID